MKVKVMCGKFECCKDIHYKIQTGTSCEKNNSKPSGWESNPRRTQMYNLFCRSTNLKFLTTMQIVAFLKKHCTSSHQPVKVKWLGWCVFKHSNERNFVFISWSQSQRGISRTSSETISHFQTYQHPAGKFINKPRECMTIDKSHRQACSDPA